jgi:hypothetical protein
MTLNEIQWSKEVQDLINEDALPTHSTCHWVAVWPNHRAPLGSSARVSDAPVKYPRRPHVCYCGISVLVLMLGKRYLSRFQGVDA